MLQHSLTRAARRWAGVRLVVKDASECRFVFQGCTCVECRTLCCVKMLDLSYFESRWGHPGSSDPAVGVFTENVVVTDVACFVHWSTSCLHIPILQQPLLPSNKELSLLIHEQRLMCPKVGAWQLASDCRSLLSRERCKHWYLKGNQRNTRTVSSQINVIFIVIMMQAPLPCNLFELQEAYASASTMPGFVSKIFAQIYPKQLMESA